VLERLRGVGSVLITASVNPSLRRVGIAFTLFGTAELGIWISLLIYAFAHGGSRAGTTIVVVQLVPCIVLGPVLGALADRRPPGRILTMTYAAQAITMAAVAIAIAVGAPVPVVFALAPLTALGLTLTRPAQAALLPAVVRTPDELTAANVLSGWAFGVAGLVGPALSGLMIAWQGPALAVGVTALLSGGAFALVAGLSDAATVVESDRGETDGEREEDGPRPTRAITRAWVEGWHGARAAASAIGDSPPIRVLLSLHTFTFVLVGAIDVLCVVLATSYLRLGPGGAGYLNAAMGAGALIAAFVIAFLIGRRYLKNTLVFSLGAGAAAIALINLSERSVPALVLIAGAGLSTTVFDVSGRTLLQRSAPSDTVAGLFSVLEALMDIGLILGAVLVQLALVVGGVRAALVAPVVAGAILVAMSWRRLGRIDDAAVVPQVEISLLRSIPIFAPLPAPALEGVARELETVDVPAGATLFREGDEGDRYYAVASGSVDIRRAGVLVHTACRGEGFGEIALIRDAPRRATVTARTEARLYAIGKEPFIETVTGHLASARAAGRVIEEHTGGTDDGSAVPGG
jgi:Major Facilitator Superfamily/Cyclic nucleotide-binding domain